MNKKILYFIVIINIKLINCGLSNSKYSAEQTEYGQYLDIRLKLIPNLKKFVDDFQHWPKDQRLQARITEHEIKLDHAHKEKVVYLALNMLDQSQTRYLIQCIEYLKKQ